MLTRFATTSDINTLIRIRFDYFRAEGWTLTDGECDMIQSQLQQYYRKHLNSDFFAVFAEEDDKAIASVAFLVISERPANLSFPTGKIGVILNVLTYPQFRRMGYATKVISRLIEKACDNDLSYIELSASELGKPLYEKLGFKKSESHFTEMKLSLTNRER